MKILEVKGISKSIDDNIIYSDINININKGDCYAILGEDNEGKSSILSAILGMGDVDEGNISLFGEKVEHGNSKQFINNIGYVPDDLICFEGMTGAEFLDMTMKLRKLDDAVEYAETLIDFFEVNPCLKLEHMDEDMNKRFYIISAFISQPEIIIMDEPFNFLNENGKKHLEKLIKIYNDFGYTVLLTGNSYDLVKDLCNRVSVIKDRRQIYTDVETDDFEDVKIIKVYNLLDYEELLLYAKNLNCSLDILKNEGDETVIRFEGELSGLKNILLQLNCDDFEVKNITSEEQLLNKDEWLEEI